MNPYPYGVTEADVKKMIKKAKLPKEDVRTILLEIVGNVVRTLIICSALVIIVAILTNNP